jgi:hypothetical protein
MATTFDNNIKSYFSDCYRKHMLFFCDLWVSADCEKNWQEIYDSVADGSMPRPGCPEGVWDSARQQAFLNDFQSWKDGGFQ